MLVQVSRHGPAAEQPSGCHSRSTECERIQGLFGQIVGSVTELCMTPM